MIRVQDLTIRQGAFSLQGISFSIPKGQYGVLMGKTGSGKTSLLEAIAGLRSFEQGTILLEDRMVHTLPPGQRNLGYVPQDGALFPTMTVGQQLGFALEVRHLPAKQVQTRVQELAHQLQISHLLDRFPHKLSGGEIQRVALGRALSYQPSILLLDEPLSSLDEETKDQMIDLLRRVQQETQVTVLHVTHSRREAEQLGTILLQLRDGKIL